MVVHKDVLIAVHVSYSFSNSKTIIGLTCFGVCASCASCLTFNCENPCLLRDKTNSELSSVLGEF